MSEKNVQFAQTLYPSEIDLVAVFADTQLIEGLRPLIHPDLEAVFEARNIPMGPASIESAGEAAQPTVTGLDGLVRAWREWLSVWDAWVMTPTEFLDVDQERVLVLMKVRARSKTHQVEMPVEGANLLTIRNGRLARLEMFLDQAEALEAAGLSE